MIPPERDPSMLEVHQAEPETYQPIEVPVKVEGDVRVRSLPAVAWNVNRFLLGDTISPVRVTGRNPFRKRLVLQSETAGFHYGASDEQVRTRNNAGFSAMNVAVELFHTEEIWCHNKSGESPVVTVVEEMWTN